MPSAQRSGLSATVGLVLVIGLLLVSGTLAVSGGGILSGGGRLGVTPTIAPSDDPDVTTAVATSAPREPGSSADTGEGTTAATAVSGQAFDYTCETGGMRDATKSKWQLNRFVAGSREGYDRVTWQMTKKGKPKNAAIVNMEWVDPKDVRDQYGIPRVSGQRAILVTFDGPVDISANQSLDQLFLDREGVQALRSIQMFEGEDGKVRTVIGMRGEGCARMSAPNFKKKNAKAKRANVFLDIEVPLPDAG